jgi:hypothetical protein
MTSAPIIQETFAAPMMIQETFAAPMMQTIAAPQMLEYSEPVLIESIPAPSASYLEGQVVQQQGSAVPFPMGPLPNLACRMEGVGSAAAYNDLRQQRDASQQAFWSMRQSEQPQTFEIAASSGAAGPIEEGFAVNGGFGGFGGATYGGYGGFGGATIIQAAPASYIGGFTQPGFVETISAPTMIEQVIEPGFIEVETFAAPTVMETFVQPTMIA